MLHIFGYMIYLIDAFENEGLTYIVLYLKHTKIKPLEILYSKNAKVPDYEYIIEKSNFSQKYLPLSNKKYILEAPCLRNL